MVSSKKLTLDLPAVYTIHLQGYLDNSWSDRLSGLSIETLKDENDYPVTTMSGELLEDGVGVVALA